LLAFGLRRSVTRAAFWGCVALALPACGTCVEDEPSSDPPRRSASHKWSQPVPLPNVIPLIPPPLRESGARPSEEDGGGAALDHE
jgi:hypothetical protein